MSRTTTRWQWLAFAIPWMVCAAAAEADSGKLPSPISTGADIAVEKRLTPERPTVILFLNPVSSAERTWAQNIRGQLDPRVGLHVVHLSTCKEPIARRYEIGETPLGMVFDRRGRLTGRSSDASQVSGTVKKALGVMRIDWAEEGTALYDDATKALHGRQPRAGILRTMTLKPEYLAYINDLANTAHFKDGFLNRRTKEMIATYVSALNKCKY